MKVRHTKLNSGYMPLLLLPVILMMAIGESYAQRNPIRIASYNIQYDNKADTANSWNKRKFLVKNIMEDDGLDLIGVQEPMPHQLDDLKSLLHGYEVLGTGVKGSVPVIYRKDRLKVLEEGLVWLSPTPDIPSVGWDASMQRKFRWVLFEDLISGRSFYLFNIHLDHLGSTARKEGTKILLAHINKINPDIPFIITGDFNSDQYSDVYKEMIRAEKLADARSVAVRVENKLWPSYNGYQLIDEAPKQEQGQIDHVFVSKNVKLLRWELLNKAYNRHYPSDHFPISIEVEL